MKTKLKHAAIATLSALAMIIVVYGCSKTKDQPTNTPAEKPVSLIPEDHTEIMKEVIKNMQQLKKRKLISKSSSGEAILTQLLTLDNVSSITKVKIKEVIKGSKLINQKEISRELQVPVNEIQSAILSENISSVAEYKNLLLSLKNNPKYQKYPELITGLDVAYKIVLDGENTIYSESSYTGIVNFNQAGINLRSFQTTGAKKVLVGVAGADVGGAIIGAVKTGTPAGAAIGAAEASAAAVISAVFDWLFD